MVWEGVARSLAYKKRPRDVREIFVLIDYSVEKLLIHCWQAFGCWGQLITLTFAPQSIISNLFPSLIWNNSFSQKIILNDVENEGAVKYAGATN